MRDDAQGEVSEYPDLDHLFARVQRQPWAGKHDLFQGTTSPLKGACDKKFLGVDCDFDEANNPNWGWFVPWGNSTPEPTPPPPLPVSHDIKWLQGILQNPRYGYHGDIDGIVGPLTEAAMIKYAETHEIS